MRVRDKSKKEKNLRARTPESVYELFPDLWLILALHMREAGPSTNRSQNNWAEISAAVITAETYLEFQSSSGKTTMQ